MQPYFMPYIGYFQLFSCVDRLVIYDDVNYIKKGWINRNNILIGGAPHLFTIPLKAASQNKLICEIDVDADKKWREKFKKTVEMNYKKAPFFYDFFPILCRIIDCPEINLSNYVTNSLKEVAMYLQIETDIVHSNNRYNNRGLEKQQRLIDVCLQEKGSTYFNPIGGVEMYSKAVFKQYGLDLFFLRPQSISYKQFDNIYVPWLSIIDVLMFNDINSVKDMLSKYDVV